MFTATAMAMISNMAKAMAAWTCKKEVSRITEAMFSSSRITAMAMRRVAETRRSVVCFTGCFFTWTSFSVVGSFVVYCGTPRARSRSAASVWPWRAALRYQRAACSMSRARAVPSS